MSRVQGSRDEFTAESHRERLGDEAALAAEPVPLLTEAEDSVTSVIM